MIIFSTSREHKNIVQLCTRSAWSMVIKVIIVKVVVMVVRVRIIMVVMDVMFI